MKQLFEVVAYLPMYYVVRKDCCYWSCTLLGFFFFCDAGSTVDELSRFCKLTTSLEICHHNQYCVFRALFKSYVPVYTSIHWLEIYNELKLSQKHKLCQCQPTEEQFLLQQTTLSLWHAHIAYYKSCSQIASLLSQCVFYNVNYLWSFPDLWAWYFIL